MDYPPPQSPAANLNVFRPRRSDDWHEYREIIEQLYRNDQLKLRDVKRIMERDYQFYASYALLFLFPFLLYLFVPHLISTEKNNTKTASPPGMSVKTSRPNRSM